MMAANGTDLADAGAAEPRYVYVRWMSAVALLAAFALADGVRISAEPAATPRLDWLFDGTVTSTARIGNTLYVGGWFRTIRPASAPLASYVSAMDPSTGATVPSNIPTANGSVTAMTSDGAGGSYLAGTFTNLGPNRIAHILANGTVDPGFSVPSVIVGGITVVARVGPSLVIGGNFLQVDGAARPLFAVNPTTGALSPWAPALPNGDTLVRDVEVANGVLLVLSAASNGFTRFVTAYDGVSGAEVWRTDVAGAPGQAARGGLALTGGRLIVGIARLYSLDPVTGAVDPVWAAGQPVGEGLTTVVADATTVYVGGSFSTYWGHPRTGLAAVDAATGGVLPWHPLVTASPYQTAFVGGLAVAPSGGVFASAAPASGPLTINGQPVGLVAQIDAAGALTAFRSTAPVESVELLQMSSTNTLFVSGFSGYVGQVNRTALAAFDLASNTLLPQTLAIAGSTGPTVDGLVASGSLLHMRGYFESINGQPRAGVATVDTTTNSPVTWPASGVAAGFPQAVGGGWEYAVLLADPTRVRRLRPVTGALDPAWQPPTGVTFDAAGGGAAFAMRGFPGPGGINGSPGSGVAFGTLDPVTGQFTERRRTTDYLTGALVRLAGDTAFVQAGIKGTVPGPTRIGETILAFDTKTFEPVARPPVAGTGMFFDIGDGRLFVAGTDIGIGSDVRYGVLEVQFPGAFTAWDAGYRTHTGFSFPASVAVRGDVVVTYGTYASDRWRVAVFTLNGASAPSNLRSHLTGRDTVFTWDPAATPPPGGYVLEGGFAAGQTAAALAVGHATSVALPMPAGPLFIRVRPQGSTEVSNEIVAGCVAAPLPPTALTTTLSGINLTLAWTAPSGPVTGYTLLAGTATGVSNAATLALGPQTSVGGPVPGGTFFARVTASNACGTSAPSGEVFFTIGAADPLPAAPTNLTSSVTGSTLTLSWTAPAGPVTGYVLEAGSAPGLANIGAATLGANTSFVVPGVPAGTYVLRVRAITSAGSGAPSTDVVVVVP